MNNPETQHRAAVELQRGQRRNDTAVAITLYFEEMLTRKKPVDSMVVEGIIMEKYEEVSEFGQRAAQERQEAAEEIPQLRQIERRCVKPAIPEWHRPTDAEMLDWLDTEAGQLRLTNEDFYGMRESFRELIARDMAKTALGPRDAQISDAVKAVMDDVKPSDAEMLHWLDTAKGRNWFFAQTPLAESESFRDLIRCQMAKGGGQ